MQCNEYPSQRYQFLLLIPIWNDNFSLLINSYYTALYFAHDLNTISGIFLLAKADMALALATLFTSNLHVFSDLPSLFIFILNRSSLLEKKKQRLISVMQLCNAN